MPSKNASIIVQIDGREALPVRAIPYVTGWAISPDEVAKNLGKKLGEDNPFARLRNTRAFHRQDGKSIQVMPKEWDAVTAQLAGFEAELRAKYSENNQGYAAWRAGAAGKLPPGVFVWLDDFKADFELDFSSGALSFMPGAERDGDRDLVLTPMLSDEVRRMVLEHFEVCEPIQLPEQLAHDVDPEWNLSARYAYQEKQKLQAGRYTLEEAARLIAESGEASEAQMLAKLESAAVNHTLPTYLPGHNSKTEYGHGPGKTRTVSTFYDECYWDDLNKWLAEFDERISFRFPAPQSGPSPVVEKSSDNGLEENAIEEAGITKREKQIRVIEAEAKRAGYEVLSIETGGKSILRAACKASRPDLFGAGDDPFNGAWKEAIGSTPPRLRMANHNKFAGK